MYLFTCLVWIDCFVKYDKVLVIKILLLIEFYKFVNIKRSLYVLCTTNTNAFR